MFGALPSGLILDCTIISRGYAGLSVQQAKYRDFADTSEAPPWRWRSGRAVAIWRLLSAIIGVLSLARVRACCLQAKPPEHNTNHASKQILQLSWKQRRDGICRMHGRCSTVDRGDGIADARAQRRPAKAAKDNIVSDSSVSGKVALCEASDISAWMSVALVCLRFSGCEGVGCVIIWGVGLWAVGLAWFV